jgi:hypothetical protein
MADPSPTTIADMLRQSLAEGKLSMLTVSSNSMAPFLRTGDQVGLEAVELSRLQPGDIITLVQQADLLTHRFWGIVNDQIQTRGDRSLTFDPLWSADRLLGRVVVRQRAGRLISLSTGVGCRVNRHLAKSIMADSKNYSQLGLNRLRHKFLYLWATLVWGLTGYLTK